MTAEVHKLKTEKDPDPAAPAIGLSVTHTTAENRNIVMQCFVPFDCSQAELDGALDKLFKASSRQEAMAKLPILRRNLEHIEKTYARNAEDLVRVDAQLDELRNTVTRVPEGRRGPQPSKADELRMERLNADRLKHATQLETGRHERNVALDTIAQLEAEIAGRA